MTHSKSVVVRPIEYGYVLFARIPQNSAYCVLSPNGDLHCQTRQPFQTRFDAVLSVLRQADYSPSRRLRFVVSLRDLPRRPNLLVPLTMFGASACEGFQDVAAPDFVFGGWPEAGISDFTQSCENLAAAGAAPPHTNLLGWYGNASVHGSRQRFVQIASSLHDRIEAVDVGNWHGRGDRLDQVGRGSSGNVMSMPEQVSRFRYLIDIEGAGYSGRLKMFLHSGRPVLAQQRPWREWFWPRMEAWKHYIPSATTSATSPPPWTSSTASPSGRERLGSKASGSLENTSPSLQLRSTGESCWGGWTAASPCQFSADAVQRRRKTPNASSARCGRT